MSAAKSHTLSYSLINFILYIGQLQDCHGNDKFCDVSKSPNKNESGAEKNGQHKYIKKYILLKVDYSIWFPDSDFFFPVFPSNKTAFVMWPADNFLMLL